MKQYGLEKFIINGVLNQNDHFKEIERQNNCVLPKTYKTFMNLTNGGEGFVGEEYLILWRVEELIQYNNEYEVNKYALGLFLFGSNGGGEAFAFDIRDTSMKISMVPFVGMDIDSALPVADSFDVFFEKLRCIDDLYE